jgi:ABC-type multidrug transport system fused ATPase/permease subunit
MAELYLPTLMSDIVDKGIINGDNGYIVRIGGLMLLVALGGAICVIIASFLSAKASTGFGRDLRSQVYTRVQSFSLHEFDKLGTATLITRTTNDIMQVQQVLMMILRMMISAPIMCIGGIIMAVSKEPTLSLVIVVVIPVLAAIIAIVSYKGMPLFRAMQVKLDSLNMVVREGLTGIRVIRAFNMVEHEAKRFDDAREILYTFSLYVKDGQIPNVFPDAGCEPAYNTVDAPLWYFEAVSKYIEYTGDIDFIREKIYKVLVQIIEAYKNGTHFNIRMDSDHLITAGDSGTQLTWMDAKVGDWVVTPRHGKAVEINALLYNALRVMSGISKKIGLDSVSYDSTAASVKASFLKAFWNENEQCLFDVISGDFKDGKIRPNQVMAAGLTYPVVEGEAAKKVVRKVWKELYAQYGLRTLSPRDKDYKGIYCGDQYYRDGAYHQGTVWAWLMGYFVSAYIKAYGDTEKNRRTAKMFIIPFIDHMRDACIGSVSEIFD